MGVSHGQKAFGSSTQVEDLQQLAIVKAPGTRETTGPVSYSVPRMPRWKALDRGR